MSPEPRLELLGENAHLLAYAPLGAAIALERQKHASHPKRAMTPLPPCQLALTGGVLSFTPRNPSDRDEWRDGAEQQIPLDYHVQVSENGTIILKENTGETEIDLSGILNAGSVNISIYSADQTGRTSTIITENFDV